MWLNYFLSRVEADFLHLNWNAWLEDKTDKSTRSHRTEWFGWNQCQDKNMFPILIYNMVNMYIIRYKVIKTCWITTVLLHHISFKWLVLWFGQIVLRIDFLGSKWPADFTARWPSIFFLMYEASSIIIFLQGSFSLLLPLLWCEPWEHTQTNTHTEYTCSLSLTSPCHCTAND